jgi:hypothetical protein
LLNEHNYQYEEFVVMMVNVYLNLNKLMLKMLLNDLLKDIDHYLIMMIELVLVYDDLLEINYLNLILMMAMLNILEEIRLHLINREDELENKIIKIN